MSPSTTLWTLRSALIFDAVRVVRVEKAPTGPDECIAVLPGQGQNRTMSKRISMVKNHNSPGMDLQFAMNT